MANIHKPDENIKTDVATVYVSLNNSASPVIYFSMANYDLAWFIAHCHANAGGTLSCQMWQRVGAAGATAVLKAAATTLVTAGTIDVSLFARGEDFTATYTQTGLIITAAGGAAITVSAVILRLRARYKQATLLA